MNQGNIRECPEEQDSYHSHQEVHDYEAIIQELNSKLSAYDLKIKKLEFNLTIADETVTELTKQLKKQDMSTMNDEDTPRKKQKVEAQVETACENQASLIGQDGVDYQQQLMEAQVLLAEKELLIDTLKDKLKQLHKYEDCEPNSSATLMEEDVEGGKPQDLKNSSMHILTLQEQQSLFRELHIKEEEIDYLRSQLAAKESAVKNLKKEDVERELFELNERYTDLSIQYEQQMDKLRSIEEREKTLQKNLDLCLEQLQQQVVLKEEKCQNNKINHQGTREEQQHVFISPIFSLNGKQTQDIKEDNVDIHVPLFESPQSIKSSAADEETMILPMSEAHKIVLKELQNHLHELEFALVQSKELWLMKSNQLKEAWKAHEDLNSQLVLKDNEIQQLSETHSMQIQQMEMHFAEKQKIFESDTARLMNKELLCLQREQWIHLEEYEQRLLDMSHVLQERDEQLQILGEKLDILEKHTVSSSLDYESKVNDYEHQLHQIHQTFLVLQESQSAEFHMELDRWKDTCHAYRIQMDQLEAELIQTRQGLDDKIQQLRLTIEERDFLEESKKNLLQETQTLSENVTYLKSVLHTGKETFMNVTSEFEHQIADLETENDALVMEKKQFISLFEQVCASMMSTQTTMTDLEESLKSVQVSFNHLQQLYNEKESQIISLRHDETLFREEILHLRDKCNTLVEHGSIRESEVSKQLDQLKETITHQTTRLDVQAKELEELTQARYLYQTERKSLIDHLSNTQIQLQTAENDLQSLRSQLTMVQQASTSMESTFRHEIMQIKADHDAHQQRALEETQHIIRELEESLSISKTTLAQYHNQAMLSEQIIKDTRQELAYQTLEYEQLKLQLANAPSLAAHQSLLVEKADAERERDDYLDRYHSLMLKVKRLEKQVAELQFQHTEMAKSSTFFKKGDNSSISSTSTHPDLLISSSHSELSRHRTDALSENIPPPPRLIEVQHLPKSILSSKNTSSSSLLSSSSSAMTSPPKKQVTIVEPELESGPDRSHHRHGLADKPSRRPLTRLSDTTTMRHHDEKCQVQ
jgi:chromosome segregation ATPase